MNQNESNSNMSNIELPHEKALKKIVRQLIDEGRDGARARLPFDLWMTTRSKLHLPQDTPANINTTIET